MQRQVDIRNPRNVYAKPVIPAGSSTMIAGRKWSLRMARIVNSLLLIAFAALPASAEELIAEFQGSGNRTSAVFEVEAPWILDWRINSDYNKMVSFDLDLVDGTTGMLQGVVLRAKTAQGNGVRMFNTSGKFRFRINASFIRWHLKVKELTPEEAELYTPRQPR